MNITDYTPSQLLKMDIAGRFGLDSKNWDERLAWFDANESNLASLAPQAEEPVLFTAAIQAWNDFKNKIPSGYGLSFDCSNSGMQLLSILTADKKAARISNVIGDSRIDGYLHIYQKMLEKLGTESTIERKDVKTAVMTSYYGSRDEPEKIFGSGKQLEVFYETLREETPLCFDLNNLWLDIWDNTREEYSWIMPDNFHINYKVTDKVKETIHFMDTPHEVVTKVNKPKDRGRALSAHTTHGTESFLVRELIRRCTMSPYIINRTKKLLNNEFTVAVKPDNKEMVELLWQLYLESGFLSSRIIPYLDSDNYHVVDKSVVLGVLDHIPMHSFHLRTVHDCFVVLPNHAVDLIKTFRYLYFELSNSDMLQFILRQILDEPQLTVDKETSFSDQILKAQYIIS